MKQSISKLPPGIEPGVLIENSMAYMIASKHIAEDLSANVPVITNKPDFCYLSATYLVK